MPMKKCPPEQVLTPPMLTVLLYGREGMYKTSIAQTAEEPYTIDTDNGAHRSKFRRYCVRFDTWADVAEIFEDPKLVDSKCVVIDTVGRFLDLLAADVRKRKQSYANGASLSPLGGGCLRNEFVSWTKALRAFGKGGKDILYLAHEKVKMDGEKSVIRPDIQGGSYSE